MYSPKATTTNKLLDEWRLSVYMILENAEISEQSLPVRIQSTAAVRKTDELV